MLWNPLGWRGWGGGRGTEMTWLKLKLVAPFLQGPMWRLPPGFCVSNRITGGSFQNEPLGQAAHRLNGSHR